MNITLLINSIINKVTGRLRSMQLKRLKWEIVSVCPVCASKEFSFYSSQKWYGYKFKLILCNSCRLVMMSPRLTSDSLYKFYMKQYRRDDDNNHIENLFARGERRGKYIEKFLVNANIELTGAKVFEIGCGYGGIINHFHQIGCKVKGCDIDPSVEHYAKTKSLDVCTGTIDIFDSVERANVLILSHVLEHIPDPILFLQKARHLIDGDGVIYLEVPGIENPRVIKNNLGVQPGHLLYFSKNTLIDICKRSGFEIVGENDIIQLIITPTI